MRPEYEQAGIRFDPAAVRLRARVESVRILRGLLAGEAVTYHGAHYQVTGHRAAPVPPSPVPLLVGGTAASSWTVAAEHADIVGFTGFSSTRAERAACPTLAPAAWRTGSARSAGGPDAASAPWS